MKPKCTDEEFIQAFRELQSMKLVHQRLGMSREAAQRRKRRIEVRHGVILPQSDPRPKYNTASIDQKAVAKLEIKDGTVLIGSDIHLWPGELTTAQRGFLRFAKELKPHTIIVNGDVFDGSQISRFPSIGWEKKPSVKDELEAVQDYLDKLLKASPNSQRFWPCGNHDARFESRLSSVAPEYAGVKGIHLKDHIPGWHPCWRVDVNEDVVVKHRHKNGLHATHNSPLWAGKTMITGHLHSLQVRPLTDYRGTRWGVDTGTLAEPDGPQFINYLEANPTNWRSGFVVLTFKGGRLLWPEIVAKFDDDHMEFRGELVAC